MSYQEPLLSLIFLVALFGTISLPRSRGKTMVVCALLGLLLVSWPPFDWLFSRPLEIWYPVRPFPASAADAIVVLSSGVDTPHFERPYALPYQDTYSRCRFAAWLYHHWKPLPVLAVGGLGLRREEGHGSAFSAAMREELIAYGVPDSSVWTEDRSRSTYENALYAAQILHSHGVTRIALVVEAQSMVRAAACFRKQNIAVVPAPSDFRQWGGWPDELLLNWKAVRRNEITLHETLGLLWYRLLGRI